jgi:Predicted phosphohydrolase
MKLFAISDLHLPANFDKPMSVFGPIWEGHWDKISADWDARVGDEDVVLIAGDLSWGLKLEDALDDLKKIGERKGIKIITRGNHDYWWSAIGKVRAALPEKMIAIQNDSIKIENFIFCGSRGWTAPEAGAKQTDEDKKIFEREKIRLDMSLESANKMRREGDKLIAMIHFPPFNSRYEDSAFTDIFKKYSVDAVVYGHLHGETSRANLKRIKGGIPYYLTSCDKLGNVLLELKFEK